MLPAYSTQPVPKLRQSYSTQPLPTMLPAYSTQPLPTNSTQPFMPTYSTQPLPTMNDLMRQANQPQNPTVPMGVVNINDIMAKDRAQNPNLDPNYQQVLDRIGLSTNEAQAKGISEAQALASRRGGAGSSTEQFGVIQAIHAAQKASRDAESNVYLADAGARQQRGLQQAAFNSDEVTSLRNMAISDRNFTAEMLLGQEGLNMARANLDAQKDIAEDQSRYGMINAGIGAILPSLFGGGGGGGGGLFSSLFGGGGGGGGGAGSLFSRLFGGGGMAANGGMAAPAGAGSSLFPGGLGAAGAAGGGFFGGMGAIPGLGLLAGGGMLASGLDNLMTSPLNKMFGRSGGAAARVLLNPVGSTINFGQKLLSNPKKAIGGITKSVSKSVKKIFPF